MMIYDLIYSVGFMVIMPWYAFKALVVPKYRAGLGEKFGFLSKRKKPEARNIWFHCVSVGETLAAAELIREFRKKHNDFKIVLSTTTNTGRAVAEKNDLADVYLYYPFDFSWNVKRYLNILNPEMIVLLELEVWPNMVIEARKRNIPIGVINGRLTEQSYKGFRQWGALMRKPFSLLSFCSVQDETYRERFIGSGALPEYTHVTGNLKYDALTEKVDTDKQNEIKQSLCIGDEDVILMGGSTHKGEEELLIDAYSLYREEVDGLRLVLVPRHPERLEEVKALIKEKGYSFYCRTELKGDEEDIKDRIILIDTMGELSLLYSLCTVAFVGGSFSGTGGQNMMEPLIFKKPVVVGPSVFNFAEDVQRLTDKEGIVTVETGEEFSKVCGKLLYDSKEREKLGSNGYNVVMNFKGALKRNLEIIEQFLVKDN